MVEYAEMIPQVRKGLYALIVSLVAFTTVVVLAPVASAGETGRLLQLLNNERTKRGMSPVSLDGTLNGIASSHAQRMANKGTVYHNSSYPSGAGSWEAWGENVGWGNNADEVHKSFMASSAHRSVILNSKFNVVGIGVSAYNGGIMVTEDFLRRPGGSPAPAPKPAAKPRRAAPPPPPPPPPPEPPKPVMVEHLYTAQPERSVDLI